MHIRRRDMHQKLSESIITLIDWLKIQFLRKVNEVNSHCSDLFRVCAMSRLRILEVTFLLRCYVIIHSSHALWVNRIPLNKKGQSKADCCCNSLKIVPLHYRHNQSEDVILSKNFSYFYQYFINLIERK